MKHSPPLTILSLLSSVGFARILRQALRPATIRDGCAPGCKLQRRLGPVSRTL
jgi:hypothetical protein